MATGEHIRRPRNLTLQQVALAALALGVVSLVSVILYSNVEGSGVRRAYESALAAQSKRAANQDLALAVGDEHVAVAAYLAAGSPAPSRPVDAASRADAALTRLAAGGEDAGLAAVRSTAGEWRLWAAREIAVVDATHQAVAEPADLERGRQLYAAFTSADGDYGRQLAARADATMTAARDRQAREATVITFGVLLAAVAMLSLAAMVAGWILRPLHRLAQLARRVAGGAYGRVPYERRGDEVGDLARALSAWQQGDRERAELTRRVAHSETRLKLIFDRAPVGICRIGLDGRILDANPALLGMFGCTLSDLLARDLADLTHADDLEGNRRLYRELEGAGATDGAPLVFERRYFRRDGSQFWGTLAVSRVSGDGDEPDHFIGMIDNISQRKARETDLETRALYDPLTGLPNRALLADRLEHAIADARRRATGFTLILMDLDGFKAVNDSCGHQAGDEVLIEVAARLRAVTRAADTVARLGGDEFVVVLPEAGSDADAQISARKLLAVFADPIQLSTGETARIGSSLGCALYPLQGSDPQSLLIHADEAMYVAKRTGSGFAFQQPLSTRSSGARNQAAEPSSAVE